MATKRPPVGFSLVIAAAVLGCANYATAPKVVASIPDLTNSPEKDFDANLGRVVTISGRLELDKFGYSLNDTPPAFYVVPTDQADGYSSTAEWEQLLDYDVRVTGKLLFKSFPKVEFKESYPHEMLPAVPHDYYYMVMQDSRIEATASRLLIPAGLLATLAIVFIVVALRRRRSATLPPAG